MIMTGGSAVAVMSKHLQVHDEYNQAESEATQSNKGQRGVDDVTSPQAAQSTKDQRGVDDVTSPQAV